MTRVEEVQFAFQQNSVMFQLKQPPIVSKFITEQICVVQLRTSIRKQKIAVSKLLYLSIRLKTSLEHTCKQML